MSTRSRIAVMHGERVKSIYCHYDGYPEGVGRTLLEHYDSAKANNLVALGDISVLRPRINPDLFEFHSFENPVEDITVFYNRDRGELDCTWTSDASLKEFVLNAGHVDYLYVNRNDQWFVAHTHDTMEDDGTITFVEEMFQPLADVLSDIVIAQGEEDYA